MPVSVEGWTPSMSENKASAQRSPPATDAKQKMIRFCPLFVAFVHPNSQAQWDLSVAPIPDMKMSPKLINKNTACADRPSLCGRKLAPNSWMELWLAAAHCDFFSILFGHGIDEIDQTGGGGKQGTCHQRVYHHYSTAPRGGWRHFVKWTVSRTRIMQTLMGMIHPLRCRPLPSLP